MRARHEGVSSAPRPVGARVKFLIDFETRKTRGTIVRKHRAICSLALATLGALALSHQVAAQPPSIARGLWVGGEKYFSEFQGKALKKSGTPRATIAFGSTDFFRPLSITFDRHHNLWTAIGGVNTGLPPVIEITPTEVASIKSGKPTKPKVILRNPGNGGVDPFIIANSLAFDAAGDLWVSDNSRRSILEFLPTQITHSGAPSPTIVITATDFVPEAIRLDASDNLWVLNARLQLPWRLLRFAPGDRAASGAPNPGLVVDLPDAINPVDLAFDSLGNLWLAGSVSQTDVLEMFPAAALGGDGEISPSAAVVVTSSAFGSLFGSGSCLGGIDFDGSGDLWVSVGADNGDCTSATQLVEFTPAQLSAGGNIDPSVTIGQNARRTNLFLPGPIRFGPTVK